MATNQFKPTSEASQSQSEYKKVSETKSLKKLKAFLNRQEVIGVDTSKAGIALTSDVVEFCKTRSYHLIGRVIYFSRGVMSE